MNPNDEIRDAILRHLYAVHCGASSPRSAAIKVSDLHKAMRELGYKRNVVGGNLDYLIQTGHVVEVTEQRTYPTKGGTMQSSPVHTYKIADKGVDRMERASLFQQPPTGQQINVTTISGVTVVGDNNVVNTRYADCRKHSDRYATSFWRLQNSARRTSSTSPPISTRCGASCRSHSLMPGLSDAPRLDWCGGRRHGRRRRGGGSKDCRPGLADHVAPGPVPSKVHPQPRLR